MNKFLFMGRLTKDPEVRYGGADNIAIARFSLAVDRRFKKEGQATADFFQISALGKLGEFVEKYLKKGTKILVEGEILNNNYEKDGKKVYSDQYKAISIEFCESKKAAGGNNEEQTSDDFVDVPDGIDEELPFK